MEVQKHHGQDRDPADAIKLGNAVQMGGRFAGCRLHRVPGAMRDRSLEISLRVARSRHNAYQILQVGV